MARAAPAMAMMMADTDIAAAAVPPLPTQSQIQPPKREIQLPIYRRRAGATDLA
jgi:hypothetical protein